MILIIYGASHTGKTRIAQKLLEKYHMPYFSLDHLKMGLIRSGKTALTPYDDDEMTVYLWDIVKEMIKTAIENKQSLIIEGCYIPHDWRASFEEEYLKEIRSVCLVMSESYITKNYDKILQYANIIEDRGEDDCPMEFLIEENRKMLEGCKNHDEEYILIDKEYDVDINL